MGIPVVFIAVAGRSNGLGPVISGNTAFPVINCPPLKETEIERDIWSSLSTPSGIYLFITNFKMCKIIITHL